MTYRVGRQVLALPEPDWICRRILLAHISRPELSFFWYGNCRLATHYQNAGSESAMRRCAACARPFFLVRPRAGGIAHCATRRTAAMNTIHGNIWLRRCDDVMRRHKGNLIPCLRSRGSSQTRSGPWPSFLLAGLILHCTLLTVAVSAQAPPATGLSAWADSWNGVHAFVVWSQSAAPDHTHPYDFAWSGGADGSNPKMVIGAYSDSTQGQQSLAWYQANHPDWILYDCDQVTPSLQVGYQAPSLDFTNPAVVDYLVSSMVSVAGAPASAISWDNFSLDNDYGTPEGGYGHFCGVWANGTGSKSSPG